MSLSLKDAFGWALEKGWPLAAAVAVGLGLVQYAPDSWLPYLPLVKEARAEYGRLFAPLLYIAAAYVIVAGVEQASKNASTSGPRAVRRWWFARRLKRLGPGERFVLQVALNNEGAVWFRTASRHVRSLLADGILENTGTLNADRCPQLCVEYNALVYLRRFPHLLDIAGEELKAVAEEAKKENEAGQS